VRSRAAYATFFSTRARCSGQNKPAFLAGRADGRISQPDLGHRPQVGRYIKVNIESGIDDAQINLAARFDYEPIVPLRNRSVVEDEPDGNPATFRYESPEHGLHVFRTYYGPMNRAFAALDAEKAAAKPTFSTWSRNQIGGRAVVSPSPQAISKP
jgi:hypothetical protein